MNVKISKAIPVIIAFVATMLLTSCGDNESTPISVENIAGKKFYTDKYLFAGTDKWQQLEIKFSSNNIAYLQKVTVDYETGTMQESDPSRATYHIDYPDVVFDYDYYGSTRSVYAHFIDNNTLVFRGEQDFSYHETYSFPYTWEDKIKGITFKSNPLTITNQYTGQKYQSEITSDYQGSFHFKLYFGSEDALFVRHMGSTYYKSFTVNYPNLSLVEKGGEVTNAHFIDATTIELTDYNDEVIVLTRIR